MNDTERIIREIIAPIAQQIESSLQNDGWNGAIGDQIWRIRPTFHNQEVDGKNEVSHEVNATLDDLNLRMVIKQQYSETGVTNTRLSSLTLK